MIFVNQTWLKNFLTWTFQRNLNASDYKSVSRLKCKMAVNCWINNSRIQVYLKFNLQHKQRIKTYLVTSIYLGTSALQWCRGYILCLLMHTTALEQVQRWSKIDMQPHLLVASYDSELQWNTEMCETGRLIFWKNSLDCDLEYIHTCNYLGKYNSLHNSI